MCVYPYSTYNGTLLGEYTAAHNTRMKLNMCKMGKLCTCVPPSVHISPFQTGTHHAMTTQALEAR